MHRHYQQNIRSFYHSNGQCRKARQYECKKNRYLDCAALKERMSFGAFHPIMFIGDHEHGHESSIKGHPRFGGHWKERRHGRYTPTIITNEYNSSQTCLFCFEKLSHPTYTINNAIKVTRETALCLNEIYPNAFKSLCRDKVSTLAIGLAGVA